MITAVPTPVRIAIFLVAILAFYISNAQKPAINGAAVVGSETFQVITQFYDYDVSRPLAINVIDSVEGSGLCQRKIEF